MPSSILSDTPFPYRAVFPSAGDRFAFDVLHDEVRPPVGQAAAVHHVGNSGVFELSQDSALLAEARDQAASDAVMHDLDRHPLLELAVAALAQVHRTHAAATDLADDAVPARSEEHTSELQSLMSLSYAVYCL